MTGRIANRTDGNHAAIVEAIRTITPTPFVQSLAAVGVGCPDLLVCHDGRVVLVEVKDGDKPHSQRGLTDAERKWHSLAKQSGVSVAIVESEQQAIEAVCAAKTV